MHRTGWWALAVGASVLMACGEAASPAPVAVRDSAGVEIVENGRPAWEEDDATPWRVAEEAVLRIGVMDGDPQYAFGSVAGAVRLPDGGIAVGDAGAQEVRFFGSDGTHLRTVGGTGGGPGEFTGLAAMGPTTDGGLWLYDFPLRRVTRLDGSGDVVAVAQLPPEPAMLNAVGMLADGSLVLRQLWGARAVAGAAATGLRRDDVAYVRFGGGPLDTLALVPGREVYVADQGGRGVMMTPLFPHSSVGAVRGDRLVIGSQDRFELDEYGPDGQLVRRIRLPAPDLGVEPGDVEEYIDRYVRAVEPERRPGIRAMLESLPAPATRPAHGSLLADRLGHLWVAEWTVFGEVPDRWNVVGPEGRWLGVVELPDGFSPLDIGPDWVVGVARDELDVEYVMAYPLERGGDGNDM